MNNLFFSGRVSKLTQHGDASSPQVWFMLVREDQIQGSSGASRKIQVCVPLNAEGAQAEFMRKYVTVGTEVFVEASLRNHRYTDGSGVDRDEFSFALHLIGLGNPSSVRRPNFRGSSEPTSAVAPCCELAPEVQAVGIS